jgi:beta-lactamase class D
MRTWPSLLPILACVALAGCAPDAPPDAAPDRLRAAHAAEEDSVEAQIDLARLFGDVEGTFVLLDPQARRAVRHNPERARTRFPPASTFKIPSTLIALETREASGPDFALVRDTLAVPRAEWWPASWTEDHTLRSAFSGSVVWFYQELARRIGQARMDEHVGRLVYGNGDTSGGIDRFWLDGGLRISPDEQVEFLSRFYHGRLGASPRSTDLVKRFLVLEETPGYRLSGKTGWAGLGALGAPQVGWLVGYLERGDDVYFFATNVEIRSPEDAAARLSITRAILRELGLMEAE